MNVVGYIRVSTQGQARDGYSLKYQDDVLKSGKWPIVDNRPFKNEEEEWPPPYYIKDPITGNYSIYHKGQDRKSTEQECKGLEVAAVWEAEHIIDRIMGNDKWNEN